MVRADVARRISKTWSRYQKFKNQEVGGRSLEEIIGAGKDKNKKLKIVKGMCGEPPWDINCFLLGWEVETGRL